MRQHALPQPGAVPQPEGEDRPGQLPAVNPPAGGDLHGEEPVAEQQRIVRAAHLHGTERTRPVAGRHLENPLPQRGQVVNAEPHLRAVRRAHHLARQFLPCLIAHHDLPFRQVDGVAE